MPVSTSQVGRRTSKNAIGQTPLRQAVGRPESPNAKVAEQPDDSSVYVSAPPAVSRWWAGLRRRVPVNFVPIVKKPEELTWLGWMFALRAMQWKGRTRVFFNMFSVFLLPVIVYAVTVYMFSK